MSTSSFVKGSIKNLLAKAGYDISRVKPPQPEPPKGRGNSMIDGLAWLKAHGVPIATVLDVGASNGCWSDLSRLYYPDAEYVLYEPQPFHAAALAQYVAANPKTRAVSKAVGAEVGTTKFNIENPWGGALKSTERTQKSIDVEVTTIDTSLRELRLNGPYLLKLDTHGYEVSILSGASQTLPSCSALIIEAYNYKITDECLLFWELCGYLYERGFLPVDLADVTHRQYDDSFWQMDLFFLSKDWKGFQYRSYK